MVVCKEVYSVSKFDLMIQSGTISIKLMSIYEYKYGINARIYLVLWENEPQVQHLRVTELTGIETVGVAAVAVVMKKVIDIWMIYKIYLNKEIKKNNKKEKCKLYSYIYVYIYT